MQRQLATIQTIKALIPIEGADRIEVAEVLGWKCVVKKNEFKVGDKIVYFEVDSLLPEMKQFEFLKERTGLKTILGEDQKDHTGYRLRTIRLRGQISQGLILSAKDFGFEDRKEGDDVTKELGVIKYDKYIMPINKSHRIPVIFPRWMPRFLGLFIKRIFPKLAIKMWSRQMKGFPSFIPKTDEIRIQAVPKVLERWKDEKFYVTEKIDGSSITVFEKDKELNVCSRSIWLPRDENNQFWDAVIPIESKLKGKLGSIALQGELIGENIQGNKLKIKGRRIYFFNAYNYAKAEYLNYKDLEGLCAELGVDIVPIIDNNFTLPKTIDELIKYSTSKSLLNQEIPNEGLVFRPLIEKRDEDLGWLSFKCINPEFLLKYDE